MEMASELPPPDLAIWICPDSHAPRAARYCVSTIEPPPAELRDLVVLLTSELVSRTVRLRPLDSRDLIELRVWVRGDRTRVELRGPHELICAPLGVSNRGGDLLLDDLQLVEALSDRWSIDADEHAARIWFEIDGGTDAGGRDARRARPRRLDGVRLDNTRHCGTPQRRTSTEPAAGVAAHAFRHRRHGVAARAWRSNRSRR